MISIEISFVLLKRMNFAIWIRNSVAPVFDSIVLVFLTDIAARLLFAENVIALVHSQ